jgi:hypothetical protein
MSIACGLISTWGIVQVISETRLIFFCLLLELLALTHTPLLG